MHRRDLLINNSPHPFGNGTISFIPHNHAWNNWMTVMTHEVRLMFLGLNVDLWNHTVVDKVVSEFGKLILWEEDFQNMARVFVKARVSGLDSIPWFLVFTEGTKPTSDSWSVQIEVFQSTLIGGLPQDEDFPPDDPADLQPDFFDFFGFGQPGHGPPQAHQGNVNNFGPGQGVPNPDDLQALGWNQWPIPQQGFNIVDQAHHNQILGHQQMQNAQDDPVP